MKQGWIKYLLYSCAVLVIGGVALFLIQLGYSYSWTGFGEYTLTNPDTVRSKTLWDWMELLIIPAVLAGGAIFLNRSERNTEREIATDRQQEAALQTYFDRMSELLLKEKLRTTKKAEVRDVARTRTLSIMRVMDTKRKVLIVQFLQEANLITDEKSLFKNANMQKMDLQYLSLQGANLEGVLLGNSNLKSANLYKANMERANLYETNLADALLDSTNFARAHFYHANLALASLFKANLERADLMYSNLKGTHLKGAYLNGANLAGADLQGADLEGANLQYANLKFVNLKYANIKDANLQGANLEDVNNITDEQLASVKSLKGATMPDGSKHE